MRRRKLSRWVKTYPSTAEVRPNMRHRRLKGLRLWRYRLRERAREAALRRTLRRPPFPLYGLPATWSGARRIGGWGTSGELGLRRVALSHSLEPSPGGARLVVQMERERHAGDHCKAEVVEHIGLRDYEDDIRPEEWRTVSVPVNGEPWTFELIEGPDDRWGAVNVGPDLVVSLIADRVALDDVTLETVEAGPYLEGEKEFRRSLRSLRRGG